MKYVKIQSTKDIVVTPGLQNQDVTNKDTHVGDRLKVAPLWPKCTVMIKKGVGYYPSEIKTWNTVKALVKAEILTIGEETDNPDKAAEMTTDTFSKKIEEIRKTTRKKSNLDEIAEG